MIRIGIAGYGNLGRGVESALSHTEDMELVGVFTRRSPDSVKTKTGVPVYSMEQAKNMTDKIDVMILCGGSANDLPKQSLHSILMSSTALTRTRRSRSILRT